MVQEMKKIVLLCTLYAMFCNTALAQEQIKTEQLLFEYDSCGALVKEFPLEAMEDSLAFAESKEDNKNAKSAPSLFGIKKERGNDFLSIFAYSLYPSGTKAELSISTLSGITIHAIEDYIENLSFDLNTLNKGTYIIVLKVGADKQAKKYIKR